MKLIILSIFHSNFIFYHKLNKDLILTLLQRSIPTPRYHPHMVFSYCVTVKPLQGIQLCYKPVRRPIITWLYCGTRVGPFFKAYLAHLLFCRAHFRHSHGMFLFAYNFQEPSGICIFLTSNFYI